MLRRCHMMQWYCDFKRRLVFYSRKYFCVPSYAFTVAFEKAMKLFFGFNKEGYANFSSGLQGFRFGSKRFMPICKDNSIICGNFVNTYGNVRVDIRSFWNPLCKTPSTSNNFADHQQSSKGEENLAENRGITVSRLNHHLLTVSYLPKYR